MRNDAEFIRESVVEIIRVLEMPIRGIPSIEVVDRDSTARLLTAAIETIIDNSQ